MTFKNLAAGITCFLVFNNFLIYGQQDNGNLFEVSWIVDNSLHNGDTSEMGAYAPEGLDIDKDGKMEFLLFDHVKFSFNPIGRIQLWENAGNDDFKLEWEIEYCAWSCQYEPGAAITVADIDKDDKQEVLIFVESMFYIYESDGMTFESGGGLPLEPTRTLYPLPDFSGGANVRSIIVKNLDSDPDLEFFMGYNMNDGLYCAIGSFPDSDLSADDWKLEFTDDFLNAEAPPGGGYRVGGIVIDDFDEDGNMEIFTSHWQDVSATRVYESDGADNYVVKHTNVPETLILYPSFDGAFANPIFHDFDGDGDAEFVISDIHGHIFVITKEASNGFEDFGPDAWTYVMNWPTVPNGGFMRSGYMGDLDQDGKPDIYYNDYKAKSILDLEYQSGPVTEPDSWIPYEILSMPGIRFGNVRPAGDLDGDGFQELVLNMGGLRDGRNLQILESQHMQISVEEKDFVKPGQYTLFQNYPNPFNPETTISYQLPKSSDVQLSIYNVNGQLMETLVNTHQQAGDHEARWSPKNASSGIYIYKLTAGNYTTYKKCMLLR